MPSRPKKLPRKKPRQARARTTVDAIEEAAAQIITREGLEALTTNRVAERAGVSIGSLYQYYPNKEALVRSMAERSEREVAGLIERASQEVLDRPLREACRVVVDLMLEAHLRNTRLQALMIESPLRIGRREVRHQAIAMTRAYLEHHRAELRPRNLELSATFVVHAIEALIEATFTWHPDQVEGQEVREEMTELVHRYLVAS